MDFLFKMLKQRPLRDVAQLLLPEPCFTTVVEKKDWLNAACMKLALSKSLGYAIMVGSSMVKLPQIMKIVSSGSVKGLSLLGNVLELLAVLFTVAYSYNMRYPISTWGEGFFMYLQTLLIVYFVIQHQRGTGSALGFVALIGVFSAYLVSGLAPTSLLEMLQFSTIGVAVVGKLMQVWANFQQGHTGQLSAITVFLLFFGALARVFTSVQETNDRLIIITFVLATIVNGMLALQVLYYWKTTQKVTDGSVVDKKRVKPASATADSRQLHAQEERNRNTGAVDGSKVRLRQAKA